MELTMMLDVASKIVDLGPGYTWKLTGDETTATFSLLFGGKTVHTDSVTIDDLDSAWVSDTVDAAVAAHRIKALRSEFGTYTFESGEVRFVPEDAPEPAQKKATARKSTTQKLARKSEPKKAEESTEPKKEPGSLAPHRPGFGRRPATSRDWFSDRPQLSAPDDDEGF